MSKILRAVHEDAQRLHAAGHMDDATMREFDALCLPPARKFTAKDVVRIRKKNHASQSVFATFLNVGKTTVAAWEQGTKKPGGAASKLLDLVDRKGLDVLT
jgi:putative transcriptional regulator